MELGTCTSNQLLPVMVRHLAFRVHGCKVLVVKRGCTLTLLGSLINADTLAPPSEVLI